MSSALLEVPVILWLVSGMGSMTRVPTDACAAIRLKVCLFARVLLLADLCNLSIDSYGLVRNRTSKKENASVLLISTTETRPVIRKVIVCNYMNPQCFNVETHSMI